MKAQKFNKKLNLKKLTVSNLNQIKAGGEDPTRPTVLICPPPTYYTCYAYTCPGWTRCPDLAC